MKSGLTSVTINGCKTSLKPDRNSEGGKKCSRVEEVVIAILVVRICGEALETKRQNDNPVASSE